MLRIPGFLVSPFRRHTPVLHRTETGDIIRASSRMKLLHRRKLWLGACAAAVLAMSQGAEARAADPGCCHAYDNLEMSRDAKGVLTVAMHTDGGPINFTARSHEDFVDAFYRIGRDRETSVVILTGKGYWMARIVFASFGNAGDPDVCSKLHDEGAQVLENTANIRVPAIEGKAWIHTEYALLANLIVVGESASSNDAPHFAGGIIPGDGIYTT